MSPLDFTNLGSDNSSKALKSALKRQPLGILKQSKSVNKSTYQEQKRATFAVGLSNQVSLQILTKAKSNTSFKIRKNSHSRKNLSHRAAKKKEVKNYSLYQKRSVMNTTASSRLQYQGGSDTKSKYPGCRAQHTRKSKGVFSTRRESSGFKIKRKYSAF